MSFITGYATDIGIQKEMNQDALMIKTADTALGKIGFFVVCDGMGGLASGEVASATAIQVMSDWFHEELPSLLATHENVESIIISSIQNELHRMNEEILSYGKVNGIQLGTTLTALLIIDKKYFTFQIGDSRAYMIGQTLEQITEDQSFVAREVARGNLTKEQATVHPQRSVLLQCIGAREEIDVVINSGNILENMSFLLCTDGFYHEIEEEEILENLQPNAIENEQQIHDELLILIERVKSRHETDNISVILTKVM